MKHNFLLLAIVVMAAFSASAQSISPAPRIDDWTNPRSRSFMKLDRMIQAHQLTEEQLAYIKSLLREQQSMIELFASHGLLSPGQMQDKTKDIFEITQFQILSLFTSEQLASWAEWDLQVVSRPAHSRILLHPISAPRH